MNVSCRLGSYKTCDLDHIVKFERAPVARLVPRERLTRARTVIDLESLDIVTSDDRVQLGARSDSRPAGQAALDQLLSPADSRTELQPLFLQEDFFQSPPSRAPGNRLNGFRFVLIVAFYVIGNLLSLMFILVQRTDTAGIMIFSKIQTSILLRTV